MRLTHRACGKTIVLGEHWVVYGAPALAVPVETVTTQVTLIRGERGLQTDVSSEHRALAEQVYEDAMRGFGLCSVTNPWRATVQSDIPVGEGLGSSAALGCALVGTLSQASQRSLTGSESMDHIFELEKRIHGTPSGLDHTVIFHEAPIVFQDRRTFEVLPWPQDCHLILASSGVAGSTREAVQAVARWRDENGSQFDTLHENMTTVIRQGIAAFQQGDMAVLGSAMSDSHAALQTVGVSTPTLNRLVQAALDAGAFGAKLTGAGLGGAVLALVSAASRSQVQEALLSAGAVQALSVRRDPS